MTFCNSAAAFKLHCGLKRDSIELRTSTKLTPILVIDTIIVYVATARVEEKSNPISPVVPPSVEGHLFLETIIYIQQLSAHERPSQTSRNTR